MKDAVQEEGLEFWPLPLEKAEQAMTDTDSGASEGGFGARVWTDANSGPSVQ
ncbi:hypothetical protein JNG37_01205 [Streptococcus suis]|nr:hypothetical protein [Streptococcus suis]MBM7268777.1 hypothetical protein [Streptococcus suis]MBM7269509.1 hypothetical protein [Streptococcus suis]